MLPVAPSAIKPAGQAFIENDKGQGELVPFVTPRAIQIGEMPYLVRQYVHGTKNALEAGSPGPADSRKCPPASRHPRPRPYR
jgi:N-ethylmaleimide reductase